MYYLANDAAFEPPQHKVSTDNFYVLHELHFKDNRVLYYAHLDGVKTNHNGEEKLELLDDTIAGLEKSKFVQVKTREITWNHG